VVAQQQLLQAQADVERQSQTKVRFQATRHAPTEQHNSSTVMWKISVTMQCMPQPGRGCDDMWHVILAEAPSSWQHVPM
jgi:hypothetical protein